jgi:excisionase family DNA binding protein
MNNKAVEPRVVRYVGYPGAEEFTGLKRNTLYAMVHHHRIPHIRLSSRMVRFDLDELESWMRSRSVGADAAR